MDIIRQIEAAGIVGCGGAGFPTHRKLAGSFRYLIANGAECEPLLRTDRYLMRHEAPALVRGLTALAEALGTERCVIAVKARYHREIQALRRAVEEAEAPVELRLLGNFYPAGDEQAVVYEVTGRAVPPGKLPAAVGAVVDNIATIFAVSQALEGRPLTEKYVTVSGAVRRPVILRVPVGTSFRECIDGAGGPVEEDCRVVSGGPMMGKFLTKAQLERAVVTKTTSGILVLPAGGWHQRKEAVPVERMLRQARAACIQCAACTQLCPRHLLGHPLEPHRIMRRLSSGTPLAQLLEEPDVRAAQLCCECGVCEVYACPMGLQPRRINALVKGELAGAGLRWQGEGAAPRPEREYRKISPQRAAARMGLGRYAGAEPEELRVLTPRQVELPLQMHIGAPCVPVVEEGARVRVGEAVALPPEGALGAAIHASITGRVLSVSDRIVLEAE